MTDSIIIIGPGESTKNFSTSSPHPTLAFSGNFKTFQDFNFAPDYWTFLDPNTLIYLYNDHKQGKFSSEFLKKLKEKTTFLYNNFQVDGTFYEHGLTTSRGNEWMINEFRNEIFPYIKSLFKNSVQVDSVMDIDYFVTYQEKIYESHKYYKKHVIINDPNDKFSKFLLPLVFHYFPEIKNIYSIGFGDFNSPRLNCPIGEVNDYESYKNQFDFIKNKLFDYLNKTGKKLIFLNPESYFNQDIHE